MGLRETRKINTIAATRIKTLAVTLVISATHPIKGGMIAPPEMAIIIRPEISFARSGYFSTVNENMSGKMFETPKPMINIIIKVNISVGAIIRPRIDTMPAIDDHIKNFRDESLVSRMAPPKVPNILPKK